MRVLLLTWACWNGGRGRAQLAMADYLSNAGHDVTVVTGDHAYSPDTLEPHHGFFPDCDWYRVHWKNRRAELVRNAVEEHDPDIVLAWANPLNGQLGSIDDRPTVAYLQTQPSFHADECWAPSPTLAAKYDELTKERGKRSRTRPIYPVWYIEENRTESFARPIDLIVHGRKFRKSMFGAASKYNIVLANNFSRVQLSRLFRQSKAFVFPRPPRFEPLGLMPIEAAAHGCNVGVPANSGVADVYPERTYDEPADHLDAIISGDPPDDPIPDSPTDPVHRMKLLVEEY